MIIFILVNERNNIKATIPLYSFNKHDLAHCFNCFNYSKKQYKGNDTFI